MIKHGDKPQQHYSLGLIVSLGSGMIHLWALSQRDGTFRGLSNIISFFLAFVFSDLLFLLSFFFLLCLRVASFFLFLFPHLLVQPLLLNSFDVAHFELFIKISSCQWLTLHPPRAVVSRPWQTRGCLHPEGICEVEGQFGIRVGSHQYSIIHS